MRASTKKQIRSGLRIGGGIGLFLIALIPAGIGVGLLVSPDLGHVTWPTALIAVGLILLGAVLLMLSTRYSVMLVCGYLLVAVFKIPFVLTSGRAFYTPHEPISRVEFAQLALFAIVSLFLLYRPIAKKPTVLERIGFAAYVLCFGLMITSKPFSILSVWAVIALAALLLQWFDKRQKGKWSRSLPFVKDRHVNSAIPRNLDA